MKKFFVLLLLLASPAWAAHSTNNPTANAAMMGGLRLPLASLPIFATFYSGGSGTTYLGTTGQIVISSGVISLADPLIPADGTQDITGKLTVTGSPATDEFITVTSTSNGTLSRSGFSVNGVGNGGNATNGILAEIAGNNTQSGGWAAGSLLLESSRIFDGVNPHGIIISCPDPLTTDSRNGIRFVTGARSTANVRMHIRTGGGIAMPGIEALTDGQSLTFKDYLGTKTMLTLSTAGGMVVAQSKGNTYSAEIDSVTTASQSYGLYVKAGTNANDNNMQWASSTGAVFGTVTGAGILSWANPILITGSTDATQLKIIQKSGQTAVPLQLFAADGTTNLFSINAAGKGNFGQGADFAGQVSNTSVYTGTAYDDNATATVKALPVAGTGWTFEVPNGKGVFVRDADQNLLAQFVDDGTTGSMVITGSKTKGQVTLNADGTTNSTVTVNSGAICMVQDETALTAEPAHSVTTTTLTIVNNVTSKGHVIDYHCF